MRIKYFFPVASLAALVSSTSNEYSFRGTRKSNAAAQLHLATQGLLQIPPSFVSKAITLFPAHHPEHDVEDLGHLIPQETKEIYYSQEGHRPALHGAKHASLKGKFVRPTVVLDHTSHLQSITCTDTAIEACFTTKEAFDAVQKTWQLPEFNIMTYHVGCGDETNGKHSYFHATGAKFDTGSLCAMVPVPKMDCY